MRPKLIGAGQVRGWDGGIIVNASLATCSILRALRRGLRPDHLSGSAEDACERSDPALNLLGCCTVELGRAASPYSSPSLPSALVYR